MKLITFGIASPAAQRARLQDIMTRRIGVPPSDPKIWFVSVASALEAFADETSMLHQDIRAKYGVLIPEESAVVGAMASTGVHPARLTTPFKLVRMEQQGAVVTDAMLADRIVVAFD